jgi:hypothetical protein
MEREESLPVPTTGTPDSMLVYAMQKGASIADIKELYALQQQFEADEARKAYTVAMAAFKAEPMEILKRKLVSFTTRDGDTTSYRHAELSDITDVVAPAMAKHGLMHQWDVRQENGGVVVDCIIKHELGHSEKVTMFAPPDSSGKKNAIQQIASSTTYLMRYTLLAATGMATKGMDDDGQGGEPVLMTEEHADTIDSLCKEIGPKILGSVLSEYRVKELAEIPDSEYEDIVRRLNVTKQQRAAK